MVDYSWVVFVREIFFYFFMIVKEIYDGERKLYDEIIVVLLRVLFI